MVKQTIGTAGTNLNSTLVHPASTGVPSRIVAKKVALCDQIIGPKRQQNRSIRAIIPRGINRSRAAVRHQPEPILTSKRVLFAILLLSIGILLPFLLALVQPSSAQPTQQALPTAHVKISPQMLSDLEIVVPNPPIAPPVAAAPTNAPEAAPADPQLAPTNAPQADPPVQGLGGELKPVATLFPTQSPDQPAQPAQPTQPVNTGFAGPSPPILMYHYIRYVDETSDPLGYQLSITPELFDAHIAWLYNNGYSTLRMDTVERCLRGEIICPERSVALTFDDGYEDAYTTVLPILQRYGFTATFYIITDSIGQPGYMSWEQIATLRDAGMEIGSHTTSHPDLTLLDPDSIDFQVTQSKSLLESQLNITVSSFCYPAGHYDGTTIERVRAAGYSNAVTTRWDSDNSDLFALPRRRIGGGTGIDAFAATVQGW